MIKDYRFKTKPYEHQLQALEKSWAQDTYALFMEMGTGKSKVLVDNIAMLYDRGAVRGALIIAPKGVYKNWNDIEGDDYFEIWTSIFDDVSEVQIRKYPRNLELIEAVSDHPSVRRLQWFTKGQYKAWELDNKIFISDLRMGVEGAYVFNFEVGLRTLTGIEIGSFQELERRPRLNQIGQVWRRIFDPTMVITERSQPLTN